jgi:GNAT superfamily N-acetyltransferase
MTPLKPGTVRIEEITGDFPAEVLDRARELLLEYGQFVVSHPAAKQFCYGSLEKEAAALPESYVAQGGGSFWAMLDERPVGFVAWRHAPGELGRHAWEMKRLWVRPEGRGTGAGRALTEAVIDRAIAAGRTAVYLDTIPGLMETAMRLYLKMGFLPCEPYGDNPVERFTCLVKYL